MYSPRQLPPHGRVWINLWLSILARTGGVVGLMLGSVVITELDAGLVGIYWNLCPSILHSLWCVPYAEYMMAIRSFSTLGMLLTAIIIMAHDYSHVLSTINACWVHHVESVSKMGLVLSITFLQYMGLHCWPGPFEFRWLKGYIYIPFYYHHQIGSIHLSHCCHIFPWLCVWDGCTTIFYHLLHVYLRNTGTVFQLLMFSLLMFSLWYLQTIGYIMACRSCSFVCRLHHLLYHHYHNYEDSSEGNKLITCLSGICCRVCV